MFAFDGRHFATDDMCTTRAPKVLAFPPNAATAWRQPDGTPGAAGAKAGFVPCRRDCAT